MQTPPLRSVTYEPTQGPTLFDRWEAGDHSTLAAPLSVRDPRYRGVVVDMLGPYLKDGSRLISVGAGNGFTETALSAASWNVLATDISESALRLCRKKGLRTSRFNLLDDTSPGQFDAVYCDGVFGHLWEPSCGSRHAWNALGSLAMPGSVAVVSNDLSDDDDVPQFGVRSEASAEFYRPPAGWFASDALATGVWTIVATTLYEYSRSNTARRREVILACYW